METYEHVNAQELLQKAKIPIEIVDTDEDIYYHMVLDMLFRINANNKAGKQTVFIVPVGPTGQYRKLVRLVHQDRISLKNVWFINMDEYLSDNGTALPMEHPLSFEGYMYREFYGVLDEALATPKNQRIFPRPGKEHEIGELIEKLGGVDTAYGGIGINGHIAFNEPPEPECPITDSQFAALSCRQLDLSRETRTINSVTAANGYIDYIPRKCITVGMKEILSSARVRFYLNRPWQKGIIRKILLGTVTRFVPASFFQQHSDAKLILASIVSEAPIGLR